MKLEKLQKRLNTKTIHNLALEMDKVRVADLCSGIGSGAFGVASLGENVEIPIAVENSEPERKTYEINHKTESYYYDIQDYFPTKKDVDLVSMIIATPPCQDFSYMNINRDTKSQKATLIYEALRIIKDINPDHFLIENVRGIKTSKDPEGRYYVDYLAKQFKKMGYKLLYDPRPAKQKYIFSSADYGVPQNRIRFILMGSKIKTPIIPKKLLRVDFGIVLDKINSPGDVNHSIEMIERFKNIQEIGKWTKLDSSKVYNTAYKLPLNGKGQCPTILNQDKTWIIWKNRVLSIDEIKGLQTLPQSYELKGNKKDKQRGLGNVFPARMSYEFTKQFIPNPDPFPKEVDYVNMKNKSLMNYLTVSN